MGAGATYGVLPKGRAQVSSELLDLMSDMESRLAGPDRERFRQDAAAALTAGTRVAVERSKQTVRRLTRHLPPRVRVVAWRAWASGLHTLPTAAISGLIVHLTEFTDAADLERRVAETKSAWPGFDAEINAWVRDADAFAGAVMSVASNADELRRVLIAGVVDVLGAVESAADSEPVAQGTQRSRRSERRPCVDVDAHPIVRRGPTRSDAIQRPLELAAL